MGRTLADWRNELGMLAALVLLVVLLPGHTPASLLPQSLVAAAPLILHAVAVILVFRACGYLNLAQVQIGLFAAVIFEGIARGQKLLTAWHAVFETCVGLQPGRTATLVNIVIALVVSIAAAVVLSWLIHLVVMQRFARSPALMATVVSVFLAQALAGLQPKVLEWLVNSRDIKLGRARRDLEAVPWHGAITVLGARVSVWAMILVATTVVCLVALALVLRRGGWGAEMRATAANGPRARTLGVNTGAVAGTAWLWAGLFAGVAGVLGKLVTRSVTPERPDGEQMSGLPQTASSLVLLLAVVVFARFVSHWMALCRRRWCSASSPPP